MKYSHASALDDVKLYSTGWVIKNYTLLYALDFKGFCEAQPTSNKIYNHVFSFA